MNTQYIGQHWSTYNYASATKCAGFGREVSSSFAVESFCDENASQQEYNNNSLNKQFVIVNHTQIPTLDSWCCLNDGTVKKNLEWPLTNQTNAGSIEHWKMQ